MKDYSNWDKREEEEIASDKLYEIVNEMYTSDIAMQIYDNLVKIEDNSNCKKEN